jgi:hypothetical protein
MIVFPQPSEQGTQAVLAEISPGREELENSLLGLLVLDHGMARKATTACSSSVQCNHQETTRDRMDEIL